MTAKAASVLRIGIFGGAFDPPHDAHLALARVALAQLQLDRLLLIPTGSAWHKPRQLTDATHRLAMCRLAFAALPGVQVDDREIRRSGPSFTVDTLFELGREYPGSKLFLIMGEDQAHALTGWHRWQELPRSATICVAARFDSSGAAGQFDALKQQVAGLQLLQMPPIPLSATEIRHKAAGRQDVAPLVPDAVARYIEQNHLYRTA